MKAKIINKKIIAEKTLLFDLELEKDIQFEAGQYCLITLLNNKYSDEKGDSRVFSILNSPQVENKVISFTTRLRDSAFKKYLAELPLESEVEVNNFNGSFLLPKNKDKELVFLAGGIGITPFISFLRFIQDNNLDFKTKLFYSNRTEESTAFLEELKMLAKDNYNFDLILTMTNDLSWKKETGRVDKEFLLKYLTTFKNKLFYISGPPIFVTAMLGLLKDFGVAGSNIKTEEFFGY